LWSSPFLWVEGARRHSIFVFCVEDDAVAESHNLVVHLGAGSSRRWTSCITGFLYHRFLGYEELQVTDFKAIVGLTAFFSDKLNFVGLESQLSVRG
jgi:hypothetical protein